MVTRLIAIVACCFFSGAPLVAADPFGLSLFAADDSLVGWNYGQAEPQGWTLRQGCLGGTQESTALISGWTLGEYELAFDWTVADGGLWSWQFRSGTGSADVVWSLSLSEDHEQAKPAAVEIDGALQVQAPPVEEGAHHTIIRWLGGRREVVVDGQAFKVRAPAEDSPRCVLQIALSAGRGTIANLVLDEPLGAALLVDGLESWQRTSPGRPWTWHDGEVRAPGTGSNYLRSEELYDNFVLALEYKQPTGGNSGLGIRTPPGGWPSGDGFELQFYDEPAGKPLNKQSTAALYGNVEPLARADRADAWNRVVVRAEGPLISVWINGQLVQHANTRDCPELKYRNPSGWIGLQDHNDPARFRNVLLRRLPPGRGPEVWYAARPEPASRWALEPLLNSERVAEALAPVGAVQLVDLREPREATIELVGPGAVVGLASGGAGRVRMMLDDALPVEFSLAELPVGAPQLAFGALRGTYLPFRERAVLEFEAAEPTTVHIEHLRFSNRVAMETTGGPPERGLLSAISYRQQQLESGRHRETDPLVTVEEAVESLTAGQSLAVAARDPRGVVKRLKLRGPESTLSHDDLWIEIVVDGEEKPAVAAPVRYLFPGLAAGKYANLVVTESDGYVNLLGMPFAAGVEVRVVNRGDEALADVGLQLVYDTLEERIVGPIDAGLRLRGAWVTSGSQPMALPAPGRLIGVIAKAPPDDAPRDADAVRAAGFDLVSLGQADERAFLSGRSGGLIWRWWLNCPRDLESAVPFEWPEEHLLLYYGRPLP